MTIKKVREKSLDKQKLISDLYNATKIKKKDIYKRIAEILETARRKNVSVNLNKLQKLDVVKDGAIVVVPGKVLSTGNLNKKIIVYALNYSKLAKEKLGANAKSLNNFLNDKIDYTKTIIIKWGFNRWK